MGVERASAGSDPDDSAWFEQLFVDTYDDLLRYAARRVGIVAAADVVAEVFLTAWRRRDDYDRAAARLWLFAAARLVVANADRSTSRALRLSLRASQSATDDRDLSDEVVTQLYVQDLLSQLPAAEAEALRLVAWDGFGPAEAAVIAGCSRATFRVRLFRARRRMAHLVAIETHVEMGIRSSVPPTVEGNASP